MYVGTADLRYLSRFDVNRGLPAPYSRRGGLGDIKPETFIQPHVPYVELSAAPAHLVQQEFDARLRSLERRSQRAKEIHTPPHPHAVGLGDLQGFFSTSKKWRKRYAAMMQDVNILRWWGYEFTPEDEKFIRTVEFRAAKERAERSGLDRVVKDIAMPVMLTIATAGAATPLALTVAGTSAAVGAVATRKLEKEAIETAEKSFAVNEEIIASEHELAKIQKDIADMQRQSGIPKQVINKGIEDAANKQVKQKNALNTLLMVGSALGVAAMAA